MVSGAFPASPFWVSMNDSSQLMSPSINCSGSCLPRPSGVQVSAEQLAGHPAVQLLPLQTLEVCVREQVPIPVSGAGGPLRSADVQRPGRPGRPALQ